MKPHFRIYLVLYLLMLSFGAHAQFYNTGSAPYNVKWRTIKTEHFQLIYPATTETLAQKYASTLDQLYPYTSHSLNHKPSKVDVILYNQSVLSNAYVVWAPKRMELVSTPPQRQYAHDWLEQLALHEYRHVVQVDKLNQGFTKGLSYLTGQMGVGAMMAFIPLWYLEGDAVVTETALTKSGRGRDPNFIQEVMAAEMLQTKRFKYDEFYLGSYKHYVPNHYYFGYQMVAWSRQEYGSETWDKVLNNVGRRPFTLAPFYFRLKKETGLSKLGVYTKTFDYLNKNWKQENNLRLKTQTNAESVETDFKSNFVSYRFPFEDTNGSILALRTSIDDVNKIVRINNGKEKTLVHLGSFQGSKVSYSQKYIAWEEIQYDLRWERKNNSVIRIYDRESHKSEVLEHKARHFAPDISPNSQTICLINNDELYNSYIEIYNILSKELVKKYNKAYSTQLSYPTWLDNEKIAVVVLSVKGKSIELLNTTTGEWQELLKPGFENISYLEGSKNNLFFSYTLDGRVNIYHLNIESKAVNRVTSMAVGANFASIDNKTDSLLFSEYTSRGYKPKKMALKADNYKSTSEITPYTYHLAESNASQELINIQDSILPQKDYESKPYSKWLNSFNIHSWLVPFYIPLDDLPDQDSKIYPGLTLLSQNSLSTVTSTLSYYYKDGYHHLRPTLLFRMIYPVIKFDYLLGGPPVLYITDKAPDQVPTSLIDNYQEFNTEISLPLNFSTSRYSFHIRPSIEHSYQKVYIADTNYYDNIEFNSDSMNYYKGYADLDYRINISASSKMAYKSLRPRWGIQYFVTHKTPIAHEQFWPQNTVQLLTAHMPGLFRHHSTRAQLGMEHGFGRRMALPRGYTHDYTLFSYNQAQKLALDYAFPIWYPNLSIGPVAYFKRVHAKVFYDYFQYSNEYSSSLNSTGVDLSIETNLFRFYWTFAPTIRYSRLIDYGRNSFDFFFTTTYGFSLGGDGQSNNRNL